MPEISVCMLRASLIWLIVAVLAGSMLLLNKAFQFSPAYWAFLPLHIEAAVLGWVLQFVFGTAYWMFPRYLKSPERGNVMPAGIMGVCLNLGVILSISGFPSGVIYLSGRVLIFVSVLLFIRLVWKRVVSYKYH